MAGEIRDTSKMCSVCLRGDFRKCRCPWHLPFDKWPYTLRQEVRAMVAGPPRPGS